MGTRICVDAWRTHRGAILLASLLALVLALGAGQDADAAIGDLTQKPGADGCVVHETEPLPGECAKSPSLVDPQEVAVSPDGANVYVASIESGSVTIFDRDPLTGSLTQKPGTAGCVTYDGSGGQCQVGVAVQNTTSATVSPDGTNVYAVAGSASTLTVFDRERPVPDPPKPPDPPAEDPDPDVTGRALLRIQGTARMNRRGLIGLKVRCAGPAAKKKARGKQRARASAVLDMATTQRVNLGRGRIAAPAGTWKATAVPRGDILVDLFDRRGSLRQTYGGRFGRSFRARQMETSGMRPEGMPSRQAILLGATGLAIRKVKVFIRGGGTKVVRTVRSPADWGIRNRLFAVTFNVPARFRNSLIAATKVQGLNARGRVVKTVRGRALNFGNY